MLVAMRGAYPIAIYLAMVLAIIVISTLATAATPSAMRPTAPTSFTTTFLTTSVSTTISTTTTSVTTTTIYPSCPKATQSIGDCNLYNNFNNVTTNYPSGSAGGGNFVVTSTPATSNTPTIESVINFNNANAQNLITCPVAPNPANTLEYFSTDMADGIYGNRCLASGSPLVTNEYLDIHTTWNLSSLASASAGPAFNNLVRGDAYALTYDGAASFDGQTPNISNGYSTNSYIFQRVPTSNQNGIWTWFADVANIPSLSSPVSESESYNGLHYDNNYTVCDSSASSCTSYTDQYTYDFQVSSTLSSLQSTTLPVPVSPTSVDYLYFNSQIYAPAAQASPHSISCSKFRVDPLSSERSCLGRYYGGTFSYLGNTGSIHFTNGTEISGLSIFSGTKYPNEYYIGQQYDTGFFTISYHFYVWTAQTTSSMPTSDVGMLPYLLYNTSTPAVQSSAANRTEFLNLSFDLYSPHNYLNAGSSLEPFPVFTGSGFFATLNNQLTEFPASLASVNNPNSSAFDTSSQFFVSAVTKSQASKTTGFGALVNGMISLVGNSISSGNQFIAGPVAAPTYIAESPNDHVYVINYTTKCGFLCFYSTTSSYLFVLKFIPEGYFNMSSNPPYSVVAKDTYSNWTSEWKNYWQGSGIQQSYNLYVTHIYNLTSDTSSWWGLGGYGNGCRGSSCIQSFLPLAMSTDYADDVFALGINAQSLGVFSSQKYELAGVLSNGTVAANNNIQLPSGFAPSGELASDAGGSYVYLANESYGNIVAYSVKNGFQEAGTFPLSYSPTQFYANMSITEYMTHGGPFGNTAIANYYSNALNNGYISLANDTSSNHAPIAIADYQGLIYVLDNWTFSMSDSHASQELSSAIWMLRVFAPNGTEIRINPSTFSDLVPSNTEALSYINAGAGSYFNGEQPPYGWPISANITYLDSSGNLQHVSYCAAGCTYTPSTLNTPYEPIGPMISYDYGLVGSSASDIGFSIDYNGTAYLLVHDHTPTFTTTYPSCGPHAGAGCGTPQTSVTYKNLYTELVGFSAPIYNYTKISLASNAKYFCYLDTQVSGETPCMTPQSSGTYTSKEASVLSNMYPPFAEVPSAFSYTTSQGSPALYQSVPTFLSSFGSPSNQGSSGSTSTSTTTTINYNQVTNAPIASSSGAPSGYTFINTSIGGAFLVPLHYTYTLNEKWVNEGCTEYYSNNGTPTGFACSSPPAGSSLGKSQSNTYNLYATAQAPVQTKHLNYTIQGGATLLQYLTSGKFYNASLLDGNVTLSSLIDYSLLTDRLIGSVYVNQTVNPQNNLANPLVINYTRALDYGTQTYKISTASGSYDAYQIELSNTITQASSGASQLKSSGSNIYAAPSQINLTLVGPGINVPFSLFSIYKLASYRDSLSLSLQGSTKPLGYDRLLYTIMDEFGNKMYAPLDADISNITSIQLSHSITTNALNPNESTVSVTGTALNCKISQLEGCNPMPTGSKVYIYYDTNLGYYNSTVTPSSDAADYYNYAIYCAFSPLSTGCALANPTYAWTWLDNGGTYTHTDNSTGTAEANNYPSFHSQFNSSSGGTACSNEPNSLLAVSTSLNCNIYGNYGLPKTKSYPTGMAYCVPTFANGTGQLTTQLGLVGIASTAANGSFSETFNVCGTGTAKIIANYYGAPSPEPMLFKQPDILNATYAPTQFAGIGTNLNTLEYNYSYAPYYASQAFPIGIYALSYGSGDAIVAVAIAVVAMALALMVQRKKAPRVPRG